jgi:hypothetical protein
MESALIEAGLDCDINYIIKLYKTENINLNKKYISVPPNVFTNYNELYNLIVLKINLLGYSDDLLEIMPIIDEYLDYIASRNT